MAEPAFRPRPVDPEPESVEVRLRVTEPEMVQDLLARPAGPERDDLALQALRIGLLALRQAAGRIDADAVRREGERILLDLGRALSRHQGEVEQHVQRTLREYFDPESGRFSERVQRLVRKDGELEQTLRRLVGEKDSELARTLAASVGEGSPVLRALSPTQSDGVVRTLSDAVEKALAEQRQRVLAAFSLDDPGSALSRLVQELRAKHGELEKGFQENVRAIRGDFSLDVKDSPLSRLVSRVEDAQQTIRREFTLDEKGSALARMRSELVALLEAQARAAGDFREEVRTTLAALTARREEAARSTRHGLVFEDDVVAFVERRAIAAGDVATRTGETVGLVPRSKVGDVVLTLGPDRAAAGAKVVVEAKEDASYVLERARAEIEEARKNRGAGVGVFVMSARTAAERFPRFARRGDDLFVVWDAEEPASDVRLEAALSVAEALSTRAARVSEERTEDLEALDKAVHAIEKQVESIEEVETSATTISNGAHRILERARKLREGLTRQVETLRDALGGLRG